MSVKLSVAFISLCAAGILLAGGISTTLSAAAAERAIDRTEDTCNNGLQRSFDLGEENSELLIQDLLTSTMDSVLAKVKSSLQAPKSSVTTLLNIMEADGIGKGSPSDTAYLGTTAATIARQMLDSNLEHGVTELAFLNLYGGLTGNASYFLQYDSPETIGRPVDEYHMMTGVELIDFPLLSILSASSTSDLPLVMGTTNSKGRVVDTGKPCNWTAPMATNGAVHSGICDWAGNGLDALMAILPSERFVGNTEFSWAPAEAKGRLITLTGFAFYKVNPSMSLLTNPGLKIVVCGLDVSIVSKILRESTFIQGTRSYAIEKNPWTGEENSLIGSSHGDAFIVKESIERQMIKIPENITSVSDLLIREHIEHKVRQNITYSELLNISESTSSLMTWSVNGSDYWIRVGSVEDKTPSTGVGLHLIVTLIIPRDVVMSTIDAGTDLVRNLIKVDNDKTSTVREEDRRNMLLIIVAVTVTMLLVSAYFSIRLIIPLTSLAEQMIEVGNMNMEAVTKESSLSVFTEVMQMQDSFYKMYDSLLEYRNYLPQSMLDQINMESDAISSVDEKLSTSDRNSVLNTPTTMSITVAGSHTTPVLSPEQLLKEHFVKKRRVSVLVTNFVGWHHRFDSDNDMCEQFSHALQKMLKAFSSNNGTPDTFNGDRLLCSFNAIRPAATHSLSAAKCISVIHSAVEEIGIQVSSSACVGHVTCGNFGCEGMKKFSLFGPVISLAYALERYGKTVGATTVLNPKMMKEICDQYSVRGLDVIFFPKYSNDPFPVHELAGRKQTLNAEWMYQIEESNKRDPWGPWNIAFEAIISKPFPHWDVAAEQLSGITSCKFSEPDVLRDRMLKWISTRQQYQEIQILYH